MTDKRLQRLIPIPMTGVGRIALTGTAVVGALATLLNFFDPGSGDSSTLSSLTFLFFAALLLAVAVADGLFRELRDMQRGRHSRRSSEQSR